MLSQRKILICGISTVALLASMPAMAAESTANNADTPVAQTVTQEDIYLMLEAGGDNIAATAGEITKIPSNFYNDLRAQFRGEKAVTDPQSAQQMIVYTGKRAEHLIGMPLRDERGMTVAVIDDIFFDKTGEPEKIIAKDSGFFGFGGKRVAFDYDAIAAEDFDSVDFKPVADSMMSDIAAYDETADAEKGWHASALLGAAMKAPDTTSVARVDDIVIDRGRAEYLVVSCGQTLGIGGQQAVVAYNDVDVVHTQDGTYIKLTQPQADVFRALAAAQYTAAVY